MCELGLEKKTNRRTYEINFKIKFYASKYKCHAIKESTVGSAVLISSNNEEEIVL